MDYARIDGFHKWMIQSLLQPENYDPFGVKRYPKKFYFSRIPEFHRKNIWKIKLWKWLYPWKFWYLWSHFCGTNLLFFQTYIYAWKGGGAPAMCICSFSKIKPFVIYTWKGHLPRIYSVPKIKCFVVCISKGHLPYAYNFLRKKKHRREAMISKSLPFCFTKSVKLVFPS